MKRKDIGIALAALCLYEGKAMKNEILRRLHL